MRLTGAVVVVIVWQVDLLLPVQSVPITTKVVSSNPLHDEMYSIQHYVIKFVSDMRKVGSFSTVTSVSFTNKTDRHDISEILLKVALNTITQTNNMRPTKRCTCIPNKLMQICVYTHKCSNTYFLRCKVKLLMV